MHDNVLLGGPVWAFAQVVILGTVALSLFVLVDSLTPRRRRLSAGPLAEPLWVYTGVMGAYLLVLLAVQLIPGLQLASAVAAVATPFALAFGVAYLLRAVFPKPALGTPAERGTEDGSSADTT